MSSITSWTRLEPQTRNAEMTGSLQARIYDPLWLLTRQWQMGEFQGEDSGSLVLATVDYDTVQQDASTPLECVVEREPAANSLRRRVDSGLHLLRLLERTRRKQISRALIDAFPLQLDTLSPLSDAEHRFYNLMRSRAPDGVKMRADSEAAKTIVLANSPNSNGVEAVFFAWTQWFDQLFSEPTGGGLWVSDELEYKADIQTFCPGSQRTPVTLQMRDYAGGHLDWFAFDMKEAATPPQPTPQPLNSEKAMPSPLYLRGMPLPRYWSFEDAGVNFGRIDTAPEDLTRLLFTEFSLLYGSDFFFMPLDIPVGSLTWIARVEVKNTFGELAIIPPMQSAATGPSATAPWQMYTLSGNALPPVLFLPAVITGSRLESEPIEQVEFARDEMADLVWAIETLVEGDGWHPIQRHEQALALRPEQPSPPEQLVYRLYTSPPTYWIPLVLGANRLQPRQGLAQGRIVTDIAAPGIPDDAVPREGLKIGRSYQYTRWIDGKTYLWIGREKHTGKGEMSSGLNFDQVQAKE